MDSMAAFRPGRPLDTTRRSPYGEPESPGKGAARTRSTPSLHPWPRRPTPRPTSTPAQQSQSPPLPPPDSTNVVGDSTHGDGGESPGHPEHYGTGPRPHRHATRRSQEPRESPGRATHPAGRAVHRRQTPGLIHVLCWRRRSRQRFSQNSAVDAERSVMNLVTLAAVTPLRRRATCMAKRHVGGARAAAADERPPRDVRGARLGSIPAQVGSTTIGSMRSSSMRLACCRPRRPRMPFFRTSRPSAGSWSSGCGRSGRERM